MKDEGLRNSNARKAERMKKAYLLVGKMKGIVGINTRLHGRVEYIDNSKQKTKVILYGFENKEKQPLFVDLHGGGFILGNAEMDDHICHKINQACECKVISVEYAKAPEYPFPYAINQVYDLIKNILEKSDAYYVDKMRIAVGGHSSGGNISNAISILAKREGTIHIQCQILDYPPLDLYTDPYDKPKPQGCIPPQMAKMFNSCYIEESDAKNPLVSPIYAHKEDITGLPPTMLILAGHDSLYDEGVKYKEIMIDSGVNVECYEYPNSKHGFTLKDSADTEDAISKMIEFLKKYL